MQRVRRGTPPGLRDIRYAILLHVFEGMDMTGKDQPDPRFLKYRNEFIPEVLPTTEMLLIG